ncbi:hypothetical protein H6P81_013548 [Aristolochia fimbriata]|uniref:Uncharacterized protein n=1 Tax=Aristolochia fimbriata TaxID=158543 RepID=A0AAV7EF01_ARIFI|nr:hypothetical protein H6P81_013548 [Aristolochia fimbriata]
MNESKAGAFSIAEPIPDAVTLALDVNKVAFSDEVQKGRTEASDGSNPRVQAEKLKETKSCIELKKRTSSLERGKRSGDGSELGRGARKRKGGDRKKRKEVDPFPKTEETVYMHSSRSG